MSDHGDAVSRLAEVHRRLLRSQDRARMAMAAQRLDLPFATCAITGDLPDVFDLNVMVVTAKVPPHVLLRSIELVAGTAGWNHRRIEIDDPTLAAELRAPLLDAGYTEERMVTMVLADPPAGESVGRPAAVVPVDAQLDLLRATTAEQPWCSTSTMVEQFVERELRLARVAGARAVVAPPEDPVSRCLLLSYEGLYEIDAVDTLVAHRRHGWSTAVMRCAVAESRREGNGDIALIADADDWPGAWYARLGFREAGRSFTYQRARAGSSSADRRTTP